VCMRTLERGGPRPRGAFSPQARRTSPEGASSPRARRTPSEGASSPQRRTPSEGASSPRARRTPPEGAFRCAALAGCGGHQGRDRVVRVF
jgi:hypothetical protein